MPKTLTPPVQSIPQIPPAAIPPRLPVTRQMVNALTDSGLLTEPTELLDGALYHNATKQNGIPERFPLTVEQVDFLYNVGLVPEKSELLDGEIREKMSQNGPHYVSVKKCRRWMVSLFEDEYVFSQSPISLSRHDNPEPDVFVATQPETAYLSVKPPATEITIVVEISDSTLEYDREEKGPRYAAGGIPEYWIVDVNARTLIVYREPTSTGYTSEVTLTENDTISPLAAPQAVIPVQDLLP